MNDIERFLQQKQKDLDLAHNHAVYLTEEWQRASKECVRLRAEIAALQKAVDFMAEPPTPGQADQE